MSDDMKAAAIQLVRRLKLGEHPYIKVGVVEFNDGARTRTELTNRQSRVISAINAVGTSGGTAIDRGIDQGMRVLIAGRDDETEGLEIREFMVVLSDGESNQGCGPVLAAANKAKSQGVVISSVCVGPDCEEQCMRRVASTPSYYYHAEHSDEIGGAFERIRQTLMKPTELRKVEVSEHLPQSLRYVEQSAIPEPSSRAADGATLRWETRRMAAEGMTMTFEVDVLASGHFSGSLESVIRYWDSEGHQGSLALDAGRLLALEPRPITTATPSPTPTRTPTPTVRPAPSPTTTSTAIPTPASVPIYLPLTLTEACAPSEMPVDVVLVIDTSRSMSGRKLADAKAAAEVFVRRLTWRDQVAIVGFDAQARMAHELTRTYDAAEQALRALEPRPGTHVDTGLVVALAELRSPRREPENRPVIILLTDGIHNGEPGADLAAAAAIRAAGIALYAIGLGRDVDEAALVAMAGSRERYAFAEDSSDLAGIYRAIYLAIDCPPAAFWGRRR